MLNYSGNIRAKGINTAAIQTYYYVGGDIMYNYTVLPFYGSLLMMFDNIKIDILLPNFSLIRGVWWSTYAKDSTQGIITNFGLLSYTTPPIMGSQWISINALANPMKALGVDPGNQNMNIQMLPQPFVAQRFYLSKITYTADPVTGKTLPQWNDGHILQFEIEVFGCDNYELDAGKCLSTNDETGGQASTTYFRKPHFRWPFFPQEQKHFS